MLTIRTNNTFQAEKTYVLHVLLHEILQLPYRLVFEDGLSDYQITLHNGCLLVVEDHFFGRYPEAQSYHADWIPTVPLPRLPHPFRADEPDLPVLYGHTVFRKDNLSAFRCGADLFGSAFFMLTRWEELVLPDRDRHGRFPAAAALAVRDGWIERPIVQEYAALFRDCLEALGMRIAPEQRAFSLHLSHDLDHPRLWWSWMDRAATVGGSLLKRTSVKEAGYWLKNHVLKSKDPFDIFDEWIALFERSGHQAHFNFMGQRAPDSDCYYPVNHPFVRDLVGKLEAAGHVIGLHPSYESFDDAALMAKELDSVQVLAKSPVCTGRQHYLRFSNPETWRVWEAAQMRWDSTMGYAEVPGFRCGIGLEFPVFDVVSRTMLRLREKPLIAMDVTLQQYMHLSPEQGWDKLVALRATLQKYSGEFVVLWHNSSWNTPEWEDWKRVYRELVTLG